MAKKKEKPERITEESVKGRSEEESTASKAEEETPKAEKVTPKVEAGAVKEEKVAYLTKAQKMKEHLAKQPKVTFMVPLMPGEAPEAVETVQLNGYRLNIKKGVFVELPRQIAQILADAYKLTLEAGKELEIGRAKDVEEALA